MELSHKIDTDNLLEKIGMASIVLGSGLNLGGTANHLIELGAAIYFFTIAYRGCKSKHDRRKADTLPKKRKILS
jgi:hypothetical protein